MSTMAHRISQGLGALGLLALVGCATVIPPVTTKTPPVASVAPPEVPTMAPSRSPSPITSQAQLTQAFSQAMNKTLDHWEFVWLPDHGGSIGELIEKITPLAVSGARRGGPYYQGSSWDWTTSNEPGEKVSVTIRYRFGSDLATKVREVDHKAENIVAEVITQGMNDYDKELALHDWLVTHSRYDLANFQANTVPAVEYSPYGVLILGTGVCESYSTAFQLLADKARLESRIVTGRGNGASHAWNQVKVDGVWYNLDVTWDDPTGATRLDHTYFNVNDQTLAAQHQWDRATAVPCTSEAANWFVRQGLIAKDLADLRAQATAAIGNRESVFVRRLAAFDPKTFQADVTSNLKKAAQAAQVNLRWVSTFDAPQGVVEVKFHYN